MISIRRLLERPEDAAELSGLTTQVRGLLKNAVAERRQWGSEIATPEFDRDTADLLRRLEVEEVSTLGLARIATEALRAFSTYSLQSTGYFREQGRTMQSMIGMLTGAVAEISAQSDASVSRLHTIERQIERTMSLDDIRALKT